MLELVAATLSLFAAGLAKGLVGLGLPPIAMGLLVLVMSPIEAAATMVVPALLTNVWQAFAGPALRSLVQRFWLMLLLTALVTVSFAGALATHAEIAIAVLGGLLVVYGIYGLISPTIVLNARTEKWAGPASGVATGIVTALTGVFSMPSVPFLQSVGLPRDVFVQAMGLSFLISSLALMAGLGMTGSFAGTSVATITLATAGAFGGLQLGVQLRKRFDDQLFRKLVLWVLIVLGVFLVLR